MKLLSLLFAAAMSVAIVGFAHAQSSLADIMSELDARTSELEQVDALLGSPDPNRRFAAMELLMKSGNPAFVQRATEVGIFSSDEELKRSALRAVFDAGGPFRILINYAGSTDDQNGIKQWLGSDGSWDDSSRIGTYVFRTQPFDEREQCWLFVNSRACAFRIVGSVVSIDGWNRATGTLELDAAGKLVGSFRYTLNNAYVTVPATIPIVE